MGQVPLKLSLACRCYLAREDAVVGTRVESRTVGGSCEGTGLCLSDSLKREELLRHCVVLGVSLPDSQRRKNCVLLVASSASVGVQKEYVYSLLTPRSTVLDVAHW